MQRLDIFLVHRLHGWCPSCTCIWNTRLWILSASLSRLCRSVREWHHALWPLAKSGCCKGAPRYAPHHIVHLLAGFSAFAFFVPVDAWWQCTYDQSILHIPFPQVLQQTVPCFGHRTIRHQHHAWSVPWSMACHFAWLPIRYDAFLCRLTLQRTGYSHCIDHRKDSWIGCSHYGCCQISCHPWRKPSWPRNGCVGDACQDALKRQLQTDHPT